jgi:hypothetical protein
MARRGIGLFGQAVRLSSSINTTRIGIWLTRSPTDMAIAVPAVAVSTFDIVSVENSLNSLFAVQNMSTGQLPYAGTPFPAGILSFTYHLYTLVGVADHYLYTVCPWYVDVVVNGLLMRWIGRCGVLESEVESVETRTWIFPLLHRLLRAHERYESQ